jgi:hypothetical protein
MKADALVETPRLRDRLNLSLRAGQTGRWCAIQNKTANSYVIEIAL